MKVGLDRVLPNLLPPNHYNYLAWVGSNFNFLLQNLNKTNLILDGLVRIALTSNALKH